MNYSDLKYFIVMKYNNKYSVSRKLYITKVENNYFFQHLTDFWKIGLKKGDMVYFSLIGYNEHNEYKLIRNLNENNFENVYFISKFYLEPDYNDLQKLNYLDVTKVKVVGDLGSNWYVNIRRLPYTLSEYDYFVTHPSGSISCDILDKITNNTSIHQDHQ